MNSELKGALFDLASIRLNPRYMSRQNAIREKPHVAVRYFTP